MSDLYNRISELCKERGIKIADLCRGTGISTGNLTDLKMGRISSLSSKNLSKVAAFFNVPMDYLLGTEDEKKPLVNNDEELTDYLQELKDRPEMRMLFSVSRKAKKEDVEAVVTLFERMIGKDIEE